jgi:proline dehydrogenase
MTHPAFNKALAHLLPWVPKPLVGFFAHDYVAGESLAQAVTRAKALNQDGKRVALNVLGEHVTHWAQVEAFVTAYQQTLSTLVAEGLDANLTLKPSQMGLELDPERCTQLFGELLSAAQAVGRTVRVEMEESSTTTATLALFRRLRQSHPNCGVVLQAMLRRSYGDLKALVTDGIANVRLCKGIYIEPHDLAYQDPELVNRNYVQMLELALTQGEFVGIATHDERLLFEAFRLIERHQPPPERFEFQMLLGVTPHLHHLITDQGYPLRVYVPYGPDWHAYCMRRLRENPKLVGYLLKAMLHPHG